MPPARTSSAPSGYSTQYARVPGLGFWRSLARDELSKAQNRLKTDILSEAIPRILAKRSEERVVRLPPDPPSTRPTIKNPDFQPPAPAKQSLQKWRSLAKHRSTWSAICLGIGGNNLTTQPGGTSKASRKAKQSLQNWRYSGMLARLFFDFSPKTAYGRVLRGDLRAIDECILPPICWKSGSR